MTCGVGVFSAVDGLLVVILLVVFVVVGQLKF